MKMKLGDMELDSESSVYSNEPSISDEDRQVRAGGGQNSLFTTFREKVQNIDVKIWTTVSIGMLLVGSGFLYALSTGLVPLLPSLLVVPIVSLAAIVVYAAYLARSRANSIEDVCSVDKRRARRLRGVLASASRALSVEQLKDRLGWTEEAVVFGLRALKSNGKLTEDLDPDSGHWIYAIDKETDEVGQIERAALSLEDRADELNRTEKKS